MAKQPKDKVVAMYDSIKDNFRGTAIHTAIPTLFIMWALDDVATTLKLNTKQRFGIAREILQYFLANEFEYPFNTLSFVVDTIVGIILGDEALRKLKPADAADDIMLLFTKDYVDAINDYIEDTIYETSFELAEAFNLENIEDDETKGATDA